MADNKNSYTYKRYIRNKNIFRIIALILGIYVLWLLYVYFSMLQATYFTIIGTITASIVVLIAFSFVKRWDKQNVDDFKWNYNTWGRGAGAELSILNALEELPQEYKTISDFSTGHGNIDFIVIGPKGIFIIESKATKGRISYMNEKFYCNDNLIQNDPIRQVIAEKSWLSSTLEQALKHSYKVTALIEFPNGKIDDSIRGPKDGIWIGGYKFHNYLIEKSNNYLSPQEITEVYNYLLTEKRAILHLYGQ